MRPLLIAILFFIMGYNVGNNIATNPKYKTQPSAELKNE
jgi:hypothetical protein